MSAGANVATVERFVEAFNQGDLAILDEITSPDFVLHTTVPGFPETIEGLRAIGNALLTAFPDQHSAIDQAITDGDMVAVRHTHRGSHLGEFMGQPPSGKSFAIMGIEIFRLVDGEIAEFWQMDDLLGLLQQLGLFPAPGGVRA